VVPVKLRATKNTLSLVFSLHSVDAMMWSLGATSLVTVGFSLFAPVTEVGTAVNCDYRSPFSSCTFFVEEGFCVSVIS